MDLTCRPTFADIEIEGENRTAIRLLVEAFDTRATSAWSQPAAWADGESPGPATDDADTDDAADDNPAQPPAGKRSADAAAADGHAAPSLELGTT
jgi:hypothetical protein